MIAQDADFDLDDHAILDMVAKAQIVLHGVQYGVFFKDIDVLRKCAIDLKECAEIVDEIVEERFEHDDTK